MHRIPAPKPHALTAGRCCTAAPSARTTAARPQTDPSLSQSVTQPPQHFQTASSPLGLVVACARAAEAAVGFSREDGTPAAAGEVPGADLRAPPEEEALHSTAQHKRGSTSSRDAENGGHAWQYTGHPRSSASRLGAAQGCGSCAAGAVARWTPAAASAHQTCARRAGWWGLRRRC